jgi:multidrug efflux pump subunit AcrA (membrane-fusion protein)
LEQQYKMAQIEGLAAQTQTNQARTELQQQAIQSRRESERERIQAAKDLQAQRLQQQAALRRESERERIQAAKDLQAQRLQQQAAAREAKSRSVGERTQIKNDPSASVVGFEKVADTGARPLEIEKFRNSATSFKSLIDDIDKYKDMIKKYGSFENPYSTTGAEMQAVARRIQMTAKNSDFFALGVLAGPDLELLESIIPTSSKISNIFKSSEAAVAQINSFKESLDKKLNDKAASLGFRRSKPLEETTIPQTQTGPRGLSVWKP